MSRSDLIRRDLLENLSALRLLSEAPAMDFDPKVAAPKAESRVLTARTSTETECLDLYEEANREVRRRIDRERRRPAIRETATQRDYWILHGGEGRRPEAVAEAYGVTVAYVQRLREAHGRAEHTGLPVRRRGRPPGSAKKASDGG